MSPVFLTTMVKPLNRWSLAFPDLQIANDLDAFSALDPKDSKVCFFDVHGFDGDSVTEAIRSLSAKGWPVVVLSGAPNDLSAFSFLSYGARGYCNVAANPQQLAQVAGAVAAGKLWVPRGIVDKFSAMPARLLSSNEALRHPFSGFDLLTERESQVATLVGRGMSNREIAMDMQISERTVKAHLTACFEKLNVRDRVQLALAANNLLER